MSETAIGRPGQIEVICGPMFSGKTEELIRRVKRAQIARRVVWVFKPQIDDRYDPIKIVSHSAQELTSIAVESSDDIKQFLENERPLPEVIGIDEAQFFDDGLILLVQRMADLGIRVVVAGLDLDYLGKPFGHMPKLLAVAELVTKQSAVCMSCGAPASRSQRVHSRPSLFGPKGTPTDKEAGVVGTSSSQVLVGAADAYEARCRRCFIEQIDMPTLAGGPSVLELPQKMRTT